MNAIYASKLFKASSRKDHIKSALADPRNQELVQQLRSYLDDKDLAKPEEETSSDDPKYSEAVPGEVYESDEDDEKAPRRSSGRSSAPAAPSASSHDHSLSDMLDDETDEGTSDTESVSEVSDSDNDAADQPSDEVGESVDIFASDATYDDLKTILNDVENTSGVRRVSERSDEVWIYYNDSVNLNTVMEQVISTVGKTFGNLEFNRLARTENAIVFQVVNNE